MRSEDSVLCEAEFFLQILNLFGIAHRGEHFKAKPSRELKGRKAHSTAGGMDQDALALAKSRKLYNGGPDGDKANWDSRRLVKAQAVRDSDRQTRRHADFSGHAAGGGESHHSISFAEMGYLGTDFFDDTGEFESHASKGAIVDNFHGDQDIPEVQTERAHRDTDAVGWQCGFYSHVLPVQGVDETRLLEAHHCLAT